jgi:hypothetical protein
VRRLACALLTCFAIEALSATPADANIWRWIEELSGPGGFWGVTVEYRVRCWVPTDIEHIDPDRVATAGIGWKLPCPEKKHLPPHQYYRFSLNVESGFLWSVDNPLQYQRGDSLVDGETVRLLPVEAFFAYQPRYGVEVAAGGGVFVFDSSQFAAFGYPVVEVRGDWRPFDMFLDPYKVSTSRNVLRMITLRAGVAFLPKPVTAARFGAPAAVNALDEPHEALLTAGIVFDYGAWRSRR